MELNYTLDKRVTGVITLRTGGKFYKEELLDIVQAMLNINGFAVVKGGNIFHVLPIQEARSEARIVHLDGRFKAGRKRDGHTDSVVKSCGTPDHNPHTKRFVNQGRLRNCPK